jgi:hypothetical protein
MVVEARRFWEPAWMDGWMVGKKVSWMWIKKR